MSAYENQSGRGLNEKALEDLMVQVRIEFNQHPYISPLRHWVISPELAARIDRDFEDHCAKLDNIEGPW